MISERRTLDEKYTAAMGSSHLEPTADRRVDVDYLIAAGFVQDGLGTSLYRLAAEWDLAGQSYRRAQAFVRECERQAGVDRLRAKRAADPAVAATMLASAARLVKVAEHEAVTAKALALVHMKSLREAAEALGNFACMQATMALFMENDQAVRKLAGKALSLWLDGNCPACTGRMFSGGHLTPKVLCTACGATGRAHFNLSKREPNSAFILGLLSQMDQKVDFVDRQMRRLLSQMDQKVDFVDRQMRRLQNGPAAKAEPAAAQALSKRLVELRSTEAEKD